MKKTNSAVILAAGMGIRLKKTMTGKPKGFLELGNQPIIQRSIQQLMSMGIERTIIVTGYQAAYYDALAERYACVHTVSNDSYATSGSMYSLYCARALIEDTFLLLESDLIYETGALNRLLKCPQPNAILLSGRTNSGDEVYVATKDNRICRMSKQRTDLDEVTGELVGISRVSPAMFGAMLEYAESVFRDSLQLDYEDCINGIAADTEVFFCKVDDLLWAEIDDETHLLRAQQDILPRILRKERSDQS